MKPGQPAKSTAKPNIHGAKVMLCVSWDPKGVLSYELLKPGETINFSVKNYLENSGWEVLPHLPYSPDLASSDYYLFRSMQNALTGIRFTSEQGVKNCLDSFLAAKPAQFFWDGIHKLPERWEKVIASDRQYFE